MLPFDFVIIGRPVPHRAKDKKALKLWRGHVAATARARWGDRPPLTTKLFLQITHFYDQPVGQPDPDLDSERTIKPVLDALNGVIYQDDYQIAELDTRRRNLNGSFRVKGISVALAEGFCQGDEFLHVKVDCLRHPDSLL
ncbi:RusA family crossover junction endodeoxyribonuclease [Leptolyngbya iicbica]|uniref:RusA family crossover junction endodeoxyribonuclease n=2 Tax=Cyanophyceae TaxID=3028117 RepID=A0A4Q7E3K5_9CYAN|nr:RusA family crossover junction endodeoxyribonuclease [Leptolyngbya sp. LK]RZM75697.1 RusA family crossover junction endodeoxyribonuclease [Leptolyngbya sp. LK]